jgi:two-component system, cell cycle sensor histidine kinase and response regulator CckA
MSSASEQILVVDDEPAVRSLVHDILQVEGYPVVDVGDAWQALGVAETCPIRLLLTDVMMPDMNGSELARRIESISPHTKVLFMSACTFDKLPDHPGAHFIAKPFSVDGIVHAVSELLAR